LYYNTHIALWEPLIEPWSFDLEASKVFEDSSKITTTIEMRADKYLNINITKAFFDTAKQTLGFWTGMKRKRTKLQPNNSPKITIFFYRRERSQGSSGYRRLPLVVH